MDNLILEPTKYTPRIHFDCQKHVLAISGKSYPENTSVFYSPVFAWLEEYLALSLSGMGKITVNIDLIYFNSSTSKVLMDLCDMLEQASEEGKTIAVNWIYEKEDEDALEFGEEFQEDYDMLEFNLVRKAS